MMEGMNLCALFVGAGGVPYRLFTQSCPEKDKIAHLIECGFGIVESCPVGEYKGGSKISQTGPVD
jgi:hypothetical protein